MLPLVQDMPMESLGEWKNYVAKSHPKYLYVRLAGQCKIAHYAKILPFWVRSKLMHFLIFSLYSFQTLYKTSTIQDKSYVHPHINILSEPFPRTSYSVSVRIHSRYTNLHMESEIIG